MKTAACLLLLALCASLPACSGQNAPGFYERSFVSLGTIVAVKIETDDPTVADDTFTQILKFLQRVEVDWHGPAGGELGRINTALQNGASITTTCELAELISRALAYQALSDGLFDPLLGELLSRWGFNESEAPSQPPPDTALRKWLDEHSDRSVISINGSTLSATRPVAIDVGGMAKGTVLDLAAQMLREAGIENAMIDAGGDLKVIGQRRGRAWRIGIRNPLAARDPSAFPTLGTVDLASGEAIVTSGNYERFFDYEGQRYHHVIDPATARPTQSAASVSVIHKNAELADAAATALMVAGPRRFDEIAARMNIDLALLVSPDGGLKLTPAMGKRLTLGRPNEA